MTALSVSISNRISPFLTTSPSCLSHFEMLLASVICPSLGSVIAWIMGASLSEYGPRSHEDVLRRGQECRLENVRLRSDSILGTDAHHWRIEAIKHSLLNRRSDLTR